MNYHRLESLALDPTDRRIIDELATNARIPHAALGRLVGLSAPGVAERIRRLEERGIIQGYTVRIDPGALGFPISAWLRVRPLPGELKRVTELLRARPEVVECHRVTGDDCFLALAHLPSVKALEALIDALLLHATTNTSIVQSAPVAPRLPALAATA
jgi:Lrp/AsnC family leucine-responsive transcriptional regulator